ncbi:MAG: immunity 22 family protein [Deltaproteobacteria bacterium]|jgi:hypothetical protein|nr:immunity 22 family protein [Deltaproteobacteria bacterium]MBT4526011.1 immunity 22 family protein [Deltaproteobacteria bacterium]
MKSTQNKNQKGLDYYHKNKVSVWISLFPYGEIPDEYFEEKFTHKKTRATNTWSNNFKLSYFNPNYMETNGIYSGTIMIKKAMGACSFSSSYVEALMTTARQKKIEEITWIVLLYDQAYDVTKSGVEKDEYMIFLGVFDYDETADNLFEADQNKA